MDTGIIEHVHDLIAGYVSEHGIEVVEIIYRREQEGTVLRVLADKPEGITIAECEALNNFLGEALDRENIIDGRYILEISSPGLDRPIQTDRDFERAMGKELTVTTYEPIDGKTSHEGKLTGMDKEKIVIESYEISTVIPRDKIAKAVLALKF